MQKHSPLPYVMTEPRRCGTHVSPPPKELIYTFDIHAPNGKGEYHSIGTFTFTSKNKEEKLATAHLIVQACNSFEPMKEALRLARNALFRTTSFDPKRLEDQIESALALAKEGNK
jgi:hypothetical protein